MALQFVNHWRRRVGLLGARLSSPGNAARKHLGQLRNFEKQVCHEEKAFADFAYTRLQSIFKDDELDARARRAALEAVLEQLKDRTIYNETKAVQKLIVDLAKLAQDHLHG